MIIKEGVVYVYGLYTGLGDLLPEKFRGCNVLMFEFAYL